MKTRSQFLGKAQRNICGIGVMALLCVWTPSLFSTTLFLDHLDTATPVGAVVTADQLLAQTTGGATLQGAGFGSPTVATGRFGQGVSTGTLGTDLQMFQWGGAPGTDPVSFTLPAGTVELFWKPALNPADWSNGYLYNLRKPLTPDNLFLYLSNGDGGPANKMRLNATTSLSDIAIRTPVAWTANDAFHHIAVSWNSVLGGTEYRLYLDGSLANSGTAAGSLGALSELPFGAFRFDNLGGQVGGEGIYDEIRISDQALYTGSSFAVPTGPFADIPLPVPEPASVGLALLGLGLIWGHRRIRKQNNNQEESRTARRNNMKVCQTLTMRTVLSTAAVLLVVTLGVPVGYGGVLWNVNFNSETVGSPPTIAPYVPGVVNTNAQFKAITGTDSILVQSSAGGLTDQPVVLINDTGGADGEPVLVFADFTTGVAVSSGKMRIGWDASVVSTDAGDGNKVFAQIVQLNPGGAAFAITLSRNFGLPGGASGFVGVDFGGQDFFPMWTLGASHHFQVDLDLSANKYTLSLDGVPFATNISDTLGPYLGMNFQTSSGLGGTTPNFEVALDNFQVEAFVPEPSSVALLLVGGAILSLHRRRQQEK